MVIVDLLSNIVLSWQETIFTHVVKEFQEIIGLILSPRVFQILIPRVDVILLAGVNLLAPERAETDLVGLNCVVVSQVHPRSQEFVFST